MSTAEIVRPPLLYSGQRLDRKEFYSRVEEWERAGLKVRGIERLEGVVYMPGTPILAYCRAVSYGYICSWLAYYSALTPEAELGIMPGSKLDDDNDPDGDAALRIRPEFGGQSKSDAKGYIEGAPELLAEIAGSSSQRDLHLKFDIYRRNGIREYLVWETIAEEFHWFSLQNGDYVRLVPDEHHIIRSRVFPGLWLDVQALLSGNLARVLDLVRLGTTSPEHAAFVAELAGKRSGN